MSEPRKATDILLELEAKVDSLVKSFQSLDLNIKIQSNKLNDILAALKQQAAPANKITVEAVDTRKKPSTQEDVSSDEELLGNPLQHFQPTDPERQIPIYAGHRLPITDKPDGFRRSSRPETFDPNHVSPELEEFQAYQATTETATPPRPGTPPVRPQQPTPTKPKPEQTSPQFPIQIPNVQDPVRAHTTQALPKPPPAKPATTKPIPEAPTQDTRTIPTQQRIVDKNGKSVFLANVEITDMDNVQPMRKTRTTGTGKWQASLPVGSYRVRIVKQDGTGEDRVEMEAIQDVQVTGQNSPLELPMLIIK
jgi:hypothetical protein